ncbi:Rossmann-like and DUF2520 domain-containing protein [Actinokineospora spheciospongiae]|uniref:Rossmann-like and DUF2520 domain-containing protein n=1 Tax=Actinokineospora spheciospongiae TaxID=909613 RepID=UPI000D717995|nr:DUF2520 domain-containing protein [Actinokineospora spheciospongiae]PWW65885.1 putative short-subunit dehydrogenase-like oxidoreductase (DUF2520 family) [Actinokineospora spheciospongiae]
MSRPARLRVGVVSAGRVGAVLGAALGRAGHTVTAAAAVSRESLRRAEELLPGTPIRPPDEVAANADLVLLALPDDRLAGMVRGLAAAGALRPGQIVVHTSGANGVGVLQPAVDAGALALAMHPVMTFTGRAEDLHRVATCSFGVTAADGDEVAWSVAEALVVEVGAEPVRIAEATRPLYHTALSHGANHLMTLVGDCADLLREAGVTAPGLAERVIAPLLSAALDNALRHGDRALTGPVARGDSGTVAKHVDVLGEHAPDLLPAYRALAARTADRAGAAGLLRPDQLPDVLAALDHEPPQEQR